MLTDYSETTYLDHAGTTLYPKSLMESFTKDLMSNLLGNPHSASSSSQLSTRRIEDVRLRVLDFFKADPDEFDLVFVANATAGIKMVMEGFREHEGGFWYGYHRDSHTSLVGVRETARAGYHCFRNDMEVEEWLGGLDPTESIGVEDALGLFAYPAQSNMNGRRLPLSWPKRLRLSKLGNRVYSLLDAAALVSTSPLDLSDTSASPDFTVLSFYKIFGFPDLGALIVHKEAAGLLQRRKYFGGGTVEMVACGREDWHIQKNGSVHERLEDGTLPIHSIIALDSAFDVHTRLFGSIQCVASHTSILAERLYQDLNAVHHYNGAKVCEMYKDETSSYSDGKTQGPIVALNFRNSEGDFVGNTEVEKLANIRNIQLRNGGLCNPGGVTSCLALAPWEMKRNFSAGHRCGNEDDVMGGKPTGVLRISLGAMSNMQDIQTLIGFIEEFFVDRRVKADPIVRSPSSTSDFHVENLTVYPIKSCSGWPVPSGTSWDVRSEGLAWDREWCLVHQGSRNALSQKRYPSMALIRPSIDLEEGLLRIQYRGPNSNLLTCEVSVPLSADPTVYQHPKAGSKLPASQVCGDDVQGETYASQEISAFFTSAIGTPCTLARFPPVATGLSTRHSKPHLSPSLKSNPAPLLLSNESPILTISRSSLNRLNEQIKLKDGKAAHASVFRANIIVAEDPTSNPGSEQPYIEDTWRSLHIGDGMELDVLGGCRRCHMVCVDQTTAEKNEEPFVTLAKTRRKGGKVYFGVHTALAGGQCRGMKVRVGERVVPVVAEDEEIGEK